MEPLISALLTNFDADHLVAPKILEKKLGCEDEASLHRLHIAIDALERIGLLVKERGKYRRVPEEGVVEGKLRCSSKGFCFAIQDVEGAEDIYIRESQLNTAWNGDQVLIKVTKEGRRRRSPEGEVRLILDRANPSVIARVKKTEQGYRAVPLDDRLLFELDLQPDHDTPDLEGAIDQLVHVEIVRYPLGQSPPIGRVTQILGSDAQSAADIDLVCCKHDFPRSFSTAALQVVEKLPTQVRKTDLKKRQDLRQLQTITIANLTAGTPFAEHALSLEQTAAGHWQVGVHVADVAYYIAPESPLDRAALKRGLAISLREKTFPLWPGLSEGICALLPGQDRLAISVLLTLNAAGELLEFEIQPTVIQVDHQLTVQQVEAVLNRHHLETQTPETQAESSLEDVLGEQNSAPVFDLVKQISAMGQALRQQRHQRGSFELSLPEPHFHRYSDEGLLGTMIAGPGWQVQVLLQEFVVLANQAIASHLQALGVPAVYRINPVPDLYNVQELIKLTRNLGIELTLAQEEAVQPQDYQTFVRQFATGDASLVLNQLLRATLKPAVYSLAAGPHFGLGLSQAYTHAVSPLSRYADGLNQRALHAVFAKGRDRRTTRAKERVNLNHSACHGQISWNVLPPEVQRDLEASFATAINHLNEREKIAQQAQQDLEGLQKAKQMQAQTGEIFRGLITGIQSYGFFVEIEALLVEGLVHVSSLKDDWYEYRSRQQTLIGRKSRRQYRLGDRVEVQVKSVDYYRQQIDLLVVGGGSEASEEETEEPELPFDVQDFDDAEDDVEMD